MTDSIRQYAEPTQSLPDKLRYQVALVFFCAILIISAVNFIDDFANGRTDQVIVNAILFAFSVGSLLYLTPNRLSPGFYTIVALVLLLDAFFLIAKGAGSGNALMWLFFVPPVAFYFLGLRSGILILTLVYVAVLTLSIVMWRHNPIAFQGDLIARFSMAFVLLSVMCGAVEYSRDRYLKLLAARTQELEEERERLRLIRDALDQRGETTPMCAACKKVRTDAEEWQEAADYIATRTGAEVSHTMCGECSVSWYPDLDSEPALRT